MKKFILLLLLISTTILADMRIVDDLSRPWNIGDDATMQAIVPPTNGYTWFNTDDALVYIYIDAEWEIIGSQGDGIRLYTVGEDYEVEDILYESVNFPDLFVVETPFTATANPDDHLTDVRQLSPVTLGAGVTIGGEVTAGAGKFQVNIAAGVGQIVDNYSRLNRRVNRVTWTEKINVVLGNAGDLSDLYTVAIDENGDALVHNGVPGLEETLDDITLDVVLVDADGDIIEILNYQWWGRDTNNQFGNLVRSLGNFKLDNNQFRVLGADATHLTITAGELHCPGCNNDISKKLSNIRAFPAIAQVTEYHYYDSTQVLPDTTTFNVTQYESAPGVLSNITANRWAFSWIGKSVSGDIYVQFGTMNSTSPSTPGEAITTACESEFVLETNINSGFIGALGLLVYQQGADLTNANLVGFSPSDKWGEICAGGGGGGIDAGGDVLGPASSADNAIARFNGTTGKVIQNSGVTLDDNNTITIPTATDNTVALQINALGGAINGKASISFQGNRGRLAYDNGIRLQTTDTGKEILFQTNMNSDEKVVGKFNLNGDVLELTPVSGTNADGVIGEVFSGFFGIMNKNIFTQDTGNSGYALIQSAAGGVFLNAAAGQSINIRNGNNASKMVINSDGIFGAVTTGTTTLEMKLCGCKVNANGTFNTQYLEQCDLCFTNGVAQHPSTGQYVLNFDAGFWLRSPVCNVTAALNGADDHFCVFREQTNSTAIIRVQCLDNNNQNSAKDESFYIMCFGVE